MVALSAGLWVAKSGLAATLSAVPMQGGMVMPMVSYHASDGRVRVMVDPTIPQLTPLRVSNPGDGFAPADPWYEWLDPSRQGWSFSRRYGFVMDTMTDPLPEGTQLWIQKVSNTPGLAVFRYSNTEPKAFEPIFGTQGASSAWPWNGMMFHPTFAAAAGTNDYAAVFEVYLAQTGTGAELSGSRSEPFEFHWTNLPDGRPELGIERRTLVFWPAATTGFALEGSDKIAGGAWTPVTISTVEVEGRVAVVLPAGETRRFFRLTSSP